MESAVESVESAGGIGDLGGGSLEHQTREAVVRRPMARFLLVGSVQPPGAARGLWRRRRGRTRPLPRGAFDHAARLLQSFLLLSNMIS